MACTDPMQFIVDLLTDNWNNANTDSNTPVIDKITNYKRYDYGANYDAIFIHRSQQRSTVSGIGVVTKDVYVDLKIDVRTLGSDKEAHWLKVVCEVTRILDNNMLNPGGTGDFCGLYPDSQREDISDKTHHLWRIIIPIQLRSYTQTR